MAKIGNFEITVSGEELSFPISVGVRGVFSCKINSKIATILGFQGNEITSTTLKDLETELNAARTAFYESSKVEEVFIKITYASSGKYKCQKQRQSQTSDFDLRNWSGAPSQIQFDYEVYLREFYSTGAESWFEMKKGLGRFDSFTNEFQSTDKYYKRQSTSRVGGKLIKYTPENERILQKAIEGIAEISEILFNFINQEPELIEATLSNGNLLPEKTKNHEQK